MKSFAWLLLVLAALALPAASSASAAELEWNQEHVAALARDLLAHVEALVAGLEARPSVPEEAAARAALTKDVERLQSRTRELAEGLAKGAGRDQTAALFHEVEALEDQAAKHTHAFPARFEAHVDIDQVQRITNQLARYYGGSSGTSYSAHGLVKAVDPAAHTVTVDHDPIPGLMPGMTMTFPVTPSASLDGIRAGQRVDFTLRRRESGKMAVTEIHPAKR